MADASDRETGDGAVTLLLGRWRAGDIAALDDLVPLLYDELKRVARRQLRGEAAGHTLGATALVNELYLRLLKQRHIASADRASFLAAAGLTMRRVLVDHARRRLRHKRGSGRNTVALDRSDDIALFSASEADEVVAVDQALRRLAVLDPRAVTIVECRVFAGMTADETAAALSLSVRTVHRTWAFARAWLRCQISSQAPADSS